MKSLIMFTIFTLAVSAQAKERSGNVSFGGIQVKVRMDVEKGFFQIGESRFSDGLAVTPRGNVMFGKKRVGINVGEETLEADIWMSGPGLVSGGHACDDVRIAIFRTTDDGKVTIVKDECAFLKTGKGE